MHLTFDQHLFSQSGLDSGFLTLLGSVVHSFHEPGEYRGSVHKVGGGQAVFYISVDKNSSAAQVNIDLAALREYAGTGDQHCCDKQTDNHFTVNPRGYVVFHVSRGSGGFNVHVRRAVEDQKERAFNSQQLEAGDIFSAVIIRPGLYSVVNQLERAKAELTVTYPEIDKVAYRPPAPERVQVSSKGFEPARVELKPGQGLVFDVKVSARIVIDLIKPDDGPTHDRKTPPHRWSKHALPEIKL